MFPTLPVTMHGFHRVVLHADSFPRYFTRAIEKHLQHRWIHLSASSAAKPGSEGGQRNNSRPRGPPARKEVEGDYLHDALLRQADYELTYDRRLVKSTTVRYSTRSVVGKFVCNTCSTRSPRMWESGVVCTELWFCPGSSRYRTLLHSQQCKRCNQYAEPDVRSGNYFHKVVRALDLWKGLREPARPSSENQNHVHTGHHDSRRCHGCLKGVCKHHAWESHGNDG
ncbi:hypothetical protein BGZ81_010272 [Podila clonocystis]|nr:hypothetical protein BGZ81_010272 [Podila clonocystis]